MTISPPEREEKKAKVVVDTDPVPTSFEKWAKPGHFDRTLARGPKTTTWIWNLHALAHDFDTHTSDLEDISRKNLLRALWSLSHSDPVAERDDISWS